VLNRQEQLLLGLVGSNPEVAVGRHELAVRRNAPLGLPRVDPAAWPAAPSDSDGLPDTATDGASAISAPLSCCAPGARTSPAARTSSPR
jgi:hypothetical protein